MVDLAPLKRAVRHVEDVAQRTLSTVGLRQSDERIAAEAQDYWNSSNERHWANNSHWRTGSAFAVDPAGTDLWAEIGRRNLDQFERAARHAGFTGPWGRVLEWGCGGGANAVHFAPRADEFIGVDVSAASIEECGRQVRAVCDTPFRPVHIDAATPEKVVDEVGGCRVFVSYYVFELLPSPAYGVRLLRLARRLLEPGGLAVIQIKYSDHRWRTRSRGRGYRSGLAEMTTYRIEEFWQLAEDCGLRPLSVELVPRNEVDERYAYFALSG